MKYTEYIFIEKPIDQVIANFDDSEKLKEWMDGLKSVEHLEGTPGEIGAKSKLVFNVGGRVIEMTETITVKDLPNKFGGTYEAEEVLNTVMNRFSSEGENRTRMETECEFEFRSLFMKVMGLFIPGMFRKQTLKNLEAFKAFAESDGGRGTED